METKPEASPECCPEFDPLLWDDKIFEWENKQFLKEKVCTIFYMPLNFGNVMKRADKTVTEAGARFLEGLCLSHHTSQWKMELYLATDKAIPGAVNATISGKFYCKVYEGPFQNTGKWSKDFEATAQSKGLVIRKLYMWYTTCPKCAKKYGKNYVAIFGQID